MTNVSQTSQAQNLSLLSEFSTKYPVENQLWEAIQQDRHTAEDAQVAVAIAMVKDILVKYCPIYCPAYQEVFNPSGSYEPYGIMLMPSAPKFAKRRSKKRNKTILGWAHAFLTEARLAEQLVTFEEKISGKLQLIS